MGTIQNAISQKTGLPPAAVGKVLEIATPMVMGYVGKMFVSQKMDTKSLTNSSWRPIKNGTAGIT